MLNVSWWSRPTVSSPLLALSHSVLESSFQRDHARQTGDFEHRADGRPARGNNEHLLPPGLQSFRKPDEECQAGTVEVRGLGEIDYQPKCAVRHGHLDSREHFSVSTRASSLTMGSCLNSALHLYDRSPLPAVHVDRIHEPPHQPFPMAPIS